MHESDHIEVMFKDHSSYIIFNIIRTLSNPFILGLFWLKMHNPSIDWKLQRMTFSIEYFENKPVRSSQVKNLYLLEQDHL